MTISNFDPISSIFKEEDSKIFTECLRLYYELFIMFNGTIQSQFNEDKEHLKTIMNCFTYNFQKYFFQQDLSKYLLAKIFL